MALGGYNSGAGLGHPDARIGHGYGSVRGGSYNDTRPLWRGFPYHLMNLDFEYDEEYDEDEDEHEEDEHDEDALKIARSTLGNYMPADAFGMHARDRRSYVDSSTYGISNAPIFAVECDMREISDVIRTRSRSSEPDSGTIYGWSSQPMWDEPKRVGGIKRPRFRDVIVDDDDDLNFDERKRDRVYQHHIAHARTESADALLRRFVRLVIAEDVLRTNSKL